MLCDEIQRRQSIPETSPHSLSTQGSPNIHVYALHLPFNLPCPQIRDLQAACPESRSCCLDTISPQTETLREGKDLCAWIIGHEMSSRIKIYILADHVSLFPI